jgi:hypothetical protein
MKCTVLMSVQKLRSVYVQKYALSTIIPMCVVVTTRLLYSCKALQCSRSHVHQVGALQLAVETVNYEKEVCLERWKEYSKLDLRLSLQWLLRLLSNGMRRCVVSSMIQTFWRKVLKFEAGSSFPIDSEHLLEKDFTSQKTVTLTV